MPTGSGKSLCYQLPALMRDDLTLVVGQQRAITFVEGQGAAARLEGVKGHALTAYQVRIRQSWMHS